MDMLFLFKYRLPDVWPIGDHAFKKGIGLTFHTEKDDDIVKLGTQFEGYRSVVAAFMYNVYDEQQNEKKRSGTSKSPQKKKAKRT